MVSFLFAGAANQVIDRRSEVEDERSLAAWQ